MLPATTTTTTTTMMICAFLVTWAFTPTVAQVLTNDDITKVCAAVRAIGNCTSCNWCSVRQGFPQNVKELCRVRDDTNSCSLALSSFPCSTITTFYTQSCSSISAWAHQIVCPIAEQATSCFATTATTTTTPTTTPTTTTATTTTTTTAAVNLGPESVPAGFLSACTQQCIRNDLVAARCSTVLTATPCDNLTPPELDGKYTCCQG